MNSSTTQNFNVFNDLCVNLIKQSILQPIVQHLQTKNVSVTIDELIAVLNNNNVISNFQPIMGIVPPMISSGSRSPSTDSPPGPGRCNFRAKRGKKTYCGKPTDGESDMCRTHKNQEANKNKKRIDVPPIAPNLGAIPGLHVELRPSDVPSIDVRPYDENRGLYIDYKYNFIIRHVNQDAPIIIGKLNTDTNVIIELSEQDKITAHNLNLTVFDENAQQTLAVGQPVCQPVQNEQTSQPTQIEQPVMPVMPAMPAIPTAPVIPGIPGIPPVPTIPNMPK